MDRVIIPLLSTSHKREFHGCTFGGSKTPEYHSWHGMRQRCLNPKSSGYKWYGARGIFIDQRWGSFFAFLEDMGSRPSKGHSLDRIDNDGPYCKENCRWATPQEQHNNTRSNVKVTLNGETKTVAQWARALDISKGTVGVRVFNGWTPERALTEKAAHKFANADNPKPRKFLVTHDGRTKGIRDWAKEVGIDRGTLQARISRYGWSVERALTTRVPQRRPVP